MWHLYVTGLWFKLESSEDPQARQALKSKYNDDHFQPMVVTVITAQFFELRREP